MLASFLTFKKKFNTWYDSKPHTIRLPITILIAIVMMAPTLYLPNVADAMGYPFSLLFRLLGYSLTLFVFLLAVLVRSR
jgi:hypothetical protein